MKRIESILVLLITVLMAVMFVSALFRPVIQMFEVAVYGFILSICILAIKIINNEEK